MLFQKVIAIPCVNWTFSFSRFIFRQRWAVCEDNATWPDKLQVTILAAFCGLANNCLGRLIAETYALLM